MHSGISPEYIRPNGAEEAFDYDFFGRLVRARHGLGETLLEYDTEGGLTAVVNRRGERLERTYDADGRLSGERSFDGREETREYNLNDRLSRITRAGGVIDFSYNEVGKVTRRASADGLTRAFLFDPCGRLLAATTGETELTCEYDAAGRLVAEVQNDRRVEHSYDADNFRVASRLLGKAVAAKFDARGRLVQIGDEANYKQALVWNELNQLIERRTSEGVRERRTYRRDNRILNQEVQGPGGNLRVRRAYDRDATGNILLCDDLNRGESSS